MDSAKPPDLFGLFGQEPVAKKDFRPSFPPASTACDCPNFFDHTVVFENLVLCRFLKGQALEDQGWIAFFTVGHRDRAAGVPGFANIRGPHVVAMLSGFDLIHEGREIAVFRERHGSQ